MNKKALDQYVNFTEQREELQKRQGELDAGDEVLSLKLLHYVQILIFSLCLTVFYVCRKSENLYQF